MPLINADFKALEWVVCVHLSKDPVGTQEILDGIDQHSSNQTAFGLGEGADGRLVAKKFVFRLIYGGSAYAYAQDAEFEHVSTSEDFWQEVIDKFYRKYEGIKTFHDGLMLEAMSTGFVTLPNGRQFPFKPTYGKWPRTTILNYPIQGMGADLMVIARTAVCGRVRRTFPKVLPISTVHDSLLFDSPSKFVEPVAEIIREEWAKIPFYYTTMFKDPFTLPTKVEILTGPNWKDMKEI
jgi:DNA polymerase I-like protein with 3'-5' exonuclease and polymerase domains